MMGKKKRSINKAKFGNYGRSTRDYETKKTIDSTELRQLALENSILMEQQSALKKRQNHGR